MTTRGLYPSTRKDVLEAQDVIEMILRPRVDCVETWQDEAGIDATVWTTAVTGTGAVARDATEAAYLKAVLSGPANADTARIRSNQRWVCAPDTYGTNTLLRRLIMEWEAKFATVASIENTTFFMGLAATTAATRATTNIVGFILASDALNSITDDGVGETTKIVGAPTLTVWHKYAIDVQTRKIAFYIDEAKVAEHTTSAGDDLPDQTMYLNFYLPQEAAAAGGQLHLALIRIWYEDIRRF